MSQPTSTSQFQQVRPTSLSISQPSGSLVTPRHHASSKLPYWNVVSAIDFTKSDESPNVRRVNAPPRFVAPSRAYAGYIFDCDGTLADTMPLHFQAWRHALAQAGARFDFSWELFISRAGMSLVRTVEELNAQFGESLDAERIAQEQYRLYKKLETQVQPIAPVIEFVNLVKKRAPVSVASGSVRASVLHTLNLIGASDLFEIIVTPEDVERGKPFPDMFLLAARKMGVPAEECLVLEDAEFGFEAARRAGMDFAAVLPGAR